MIYERAQVEFNQMLVERFIQCIGIYPFGTLVLLDTEEMGLSVESTPKPSSGPMFSSSTVTRRTPTRVPFMADLTEKATSPRITNEPSSCPSTPSSGISGSMPTCRYADKPERKMA